MSDFILKIYDYFKSHKFLLNSLLAMITLLMVIMVIQINYKEDISDFLPLEGNNQKALKIYQDISGANKLFVIFQNKDTAANDPNKIVAAIEGFVTNFKSRDKEGVSKTLVSQIDMDKISEVTDFIYSNIPYFLTDADYHRIDSLINNPDFVAKQLQLDKQLLMFPTGGMLSDNIGRDPLNLFTPIAAKLQHSESGLSYELYDGYIFSPDMKKAIVMLDSPYGSSETEKNTLLLNKLQESIDQTISTNPDVYAHVIGGPAIAVGNSSRIKTDSIISVAIAIVLILILLFFTIRNIRNLILIVISIAWGWLFALTGLALFHDDISIIVLGVSSVILGIAVNYPLHLITHLNHAESTRHALKELIAPLVVGNITTVGAFLALVPLQSVALRELGIFAAFLLIGTIIFVMVYLPQVMSFKDKSQSLSIFKNIGEFSLENKKWIVYLVVALTIIFSYFSFYTGFDSDMSHINYMTDEQKADLVYFQKMMQKATGSDNIYVVSSDKDINAALDKNIALNKKLKEVTKNDSSVSISSCSDFICSENEQNKRLQKWNKFITKYGTTIKQRLQDTANKEGFSDDSFDDFYSILDGSYKPKPVTKFDLLMHNVFSNNLSIDTKNSDCNIVDIIKVTKGQRDKIEKILDSDSLLGDSFYFDAQSMTSSLANNLSNNFNYIGWACGLIVFFFLWFSFGSIELAMLSFLPMAVSWVWILGIMSIMGIEFNIVNVILATFIFGQGDDYTIFMTEGASYEYAYRKKMLASYKSSIIISALIMFIGIGSLIVAKHPALHSLAEVTIVGMFSVVLMAYLFPPLIFKWLISKNGEYRVRPVSIKPLTSMGISAIGFFSQIITVYALGFIIFCLLPRSDRRKAMFRNYVHRLFKHDMSHLPNVKFTVHNPVNEDFNSPAIIVSNHQSMLDSSCFMALTSKAVIVANENASMNFVIRKIFKWLDYYTISSTESFDMDKMRDYINRGYSIVLFPEGERNADSSILRFHKGAFYIAHELKTDIVPVILHGLNDVLPRNSCSLYSGEISINIEPRIHYADLKADYQETTKQIHELYVTRYAELKTSYENAVYFKNFVIDRYRYKGTEVFNKVKKNLKKNDCFSKYIDCAPTVENMVIINNGYGEFALLMALVNPNINIYTYECDDDKRELSRYSSDIAHNLVTLDSLNDVLKLLKEKHSAQVYILGEIDDKSQPFDKYNPIIISNA